MHTWSYWLWRWLGAYVVRPPAPARPPTRQLLAEIQRQQAEIAARQRFLNEVLAVIRRYEEPPHA